MKSYLTWEKRKLKECSEGRKTLIDVKTRINDRKSKIPVVYDVDVDIETESYSRDDESKEGELESFSENSHDSS